MTTRTGWITHALARRSIVHASRGTPILGSEADPGADVADVPDIVTVAELRIDPVGIQALGTQGTGIQALGTQADIVQVLLEFILGDPDEVAKIIITDATGDRTRVPLVNMQPRCHSAINAQMFDQL